MKEIGLRLEEVVFVLKKKFKDKSNDLILFRTICQPLAFFLNPLSQMGL